jgi:hypothetical protein
MPTKIKPQTTLMLSLSAFDLAMLGSITLFYEIEQATRFYHLKNFEYPQLKTASILFLASAVIIFSSILIYGILRPWLIDKPAYENDDDKVKSEDQQKLMAAYVVKGIVSTLLLCGGFFAVGMGFLQKAEMYAYRANRYPDSSRSNMSKYAIGGAVLFVAFLLFAGAAAYCISKVWKDETNHPKGMRFLAGVFVTLSAASIFFGTSLIVAGVSTNPPNINLGMNENVTLWILCGFSLLAGGVLFRDIAQSYIRYLKNQKTDEHNESIEQPKPFKTSKVIVVDHSDDDDEDRQSNERLLSPSHSRSMETNVSYFSDHEQDQNDDDTEENDKTFQQFFGIKNLENVRARFRSHPVALIGIPASTFIAASLIITSTVLIYNHPELNQDTLNIYKSSHILAGVGVGFLALGFLAKITFGSHEDDEQMAANYQPHQQY